MAFYPHVFDAPLERLGIGRDRQVWYTVLFLPAGLAAGLPFDRHPRLRVDGEIADVPVAGAWNPVGDGRRYFIVSPRVLTAGAVSVGQRVEMRFRVVDQAAVDVPEALARALSSDAAARSAWDALRPGQRRGLAHLVSSARTEPTRARRVADVLARLTSDSPDASRLGRPPAARARG